MTTRDAALERSALVKASWRLLPLIALGYGISYMDRVNISFAALQMNRDLHFSATVYGLGAGLFFLSYALFEVPSNLLLVRFGPRLWIARIMLTWGVLAAGMMFVTTPMQFYVMRFLLGFAEAGFFPGVLYYLTLWFPAAHRGRAISRFYVAIPLSTVVMGAIAGALLNLQGRLGLAGWQWLFLVEGLPAILLSAVILFAMPNRPREAKWLTTEEKDWIERRLAAEAAALGGADHNIARALLNPAVLALAAVNFLFLGSSYAFNLSAPTLLRDATHFSATTIGFLVSIGGLGGAAVMIFNGWHSDRSGERHLHLATPLLLIAAAFVVMALAQTPAVVVAAYLVWMWASQGVSAVFWLIPGGIPHPRSAAVCVAAINAIGQLGSFFMPTLWGIARDQTGSFHAGLAALPLAFLVSAGIVLVLRRRAGRLTPALA
ncbi:MAG: transporter, family, tartrate transporter [Phenylobacterium sp.]|nr:transporter, family, tartrate transporter [Phenylobacterium sp.]